MSGHRGLAARPRRVFETAARIAASMLLAAGLTAAGPATAQTATAIEYRHADWNHYFITAIPGEVTALDTGAFGPAWSRTGYSFAVFVDPAPGRSPVCRFFTGASFAPRSSHFYTPIPSECASLPQGGIWQYEGTVFHLVAPDGAGNCGDGTRALYRLYNEAQGGAPNHRYTTSKTVFNQMVAAGWTPEGYGPETVFSCVPDAGGASTAEGRWLGTSSRGETVRGYVLENGTFYLHSTPAGSTLPTLVLQGTASSSDGQFASADAKDFPGAVPGFVQPVTVAGTYVARTSLALEVNGPASAQRTLTLAYDPGYETPADPAAIAGVYFGQSGHAPGNLPVSFTVLGNGQFGGTNALCSFTGTVVPRGSVNVFDLTVVGNTPGCIYGQGFPVQGITDYDPAARRYIGLTPFSARSDLYHLIGTQP